MIPLLHPLVKTATELRRSINRLRIFREQNPNDEHVASGAVDSLMNDLIEARSHIPRELRDSDLE